MSRVPGQRGTPPPLLRGVFGHCPACGSDLCRLRGDGVLAPVGHELGHERCPGVGGRPAAVRGGAGFCVPGAGRVHGAMLMTYRPARPWEVALEFNPTFEATVWSVGRGLLVAGLRRAVGVGDVRVGPECARWLSLRLTGTAAGTGAVRTEELWCERRQMAWFLRATMVVVPFGREPRIWQPAALPADWGV
ncbi:MAG: SsgA family sporulation/cell division regulator [Acidimicrobiales bacterium]